MSSYVIYLPEARGANPENLTKVGLGDLREGSEFADCLDGGPGDVRGMLVAWRTGDSTRDPSFSPRDFDWRPAKADRKRKLAAKRFWLGVQRGKRVEPNSIARRTSVAGYPITLADGQVWRIPAAVHLPHVHALGESGEFERRVADEYREIWEMSERYAVEFFQAIDQIELLKAKRPGIAAESNVSFTLSDCDFYCSRVLAVNYRVTPEIVDFLGLLNDEATRNIIKASIDLTCILEANDQKKTDDLTIDVS